MLVISFFILINEQLDIPLNIKIMRRRRWRKEGMKDKKKEAVVQSGAPSK